MRWITTGARAASTTCETVHRGFWLAIDNRSVPELLAWDARKSTWRAATDPEPTPPSRSYTNAREVVMGPTEVVLVFVTWILLAAAAVAQYLLSDGESPP